MRQAGSEDLDCGRQRGRQLIPVWAGEISSFCLAQTRTNGLKCFSIFGQSHLAVGRGTALPAWAANTDKALLICWLFVIRQVEQVQELNRHNKQGHCEPRPCQSGGWGGALPLLAGVPHLRRGPPNQEGLCSLLTEQPLGCLWPGRTRDSGGKILFAVLITVVIVVLWGVWRLSLRELCHPLPELLGNSLQ